MSELILDDVILFCKSPALAKSIEKLIEAKELRYKSCFDLKTSLAWFGTRRFALALVDGSIAESELTEFIKLTWATNKHTRIIVFGADNKRALNLILQGAESIKLQKLNKLVSEALDNLKEQKLKVATKSHLLVVEDLDSPRDIICLFLESLGYEQISSVASAQEALNLLKENPAKFTTVLTDVRMPNMHGDELVRIIRRDSDLTRLPVIVLTAYGTADCLFDCLKAGASGFLVKPAKKTDLKRELERAERVRASGTRVRLVDEEQVEQLFDLLVEQGHVV